MRAYDEAKAQAILDLLQVGVTLTAACARVSQSHGGAKVTFGDWHKWLNTEEGIASDLEGRYLRARELRAHLYAEEIVALADSSTPETAHVVRLQIDARKWVASKLMPRAYGDRVQVDTTTRAADPRELSTPELVAMIQRQKAAAEETKH